MRAITVTPGGKVVQDVEYPEAKEVKRAAIAAAEATAETEAAAESAAIRQSRPAADIIQKIKDGTNLTAAEMQLVVRHLALRALRER